MISTSSFSDEGDRNSVLRIHPSHFAALQHFDVAVMRDTLLLIELETEEFCVDLQALSTLVLSDLGATLQVLRLAGREYGNVEGRPVRVEDCIADLGIQACKKAMSEHLMPRDVHSSAVAELWRHSREIAGLSRHFAERTVDVDPDQAYLVGLCHSIGSLRGVLGLEVNTHQKSDRMRIGRALAREWSLPGCVSDYFADPGKCGERSAWQGIVQAAHQCAGGPTGECVSAGDISSELLWAV